MKKLSIVREEFRKGNFTSAKINVEKSDKEEDMPFVTKHKIK